MAGQKGFLIDMGSVDRVFWVPCFDLEKILELSHTQHNHIAVINSTVVVAVAIRTKKRLSARALTAPIHFCFCAGVASKSFL